jgi:hypothetical protein
MGCMDGSIPLLCYGLRNTGPTSCWKTQHTTVAYCLLLRSRSTFFLSKEDDHQSLPPTTGHISFFAFAAFAPMVILFFISKLYVALSDHIFEINVFMRLLFINDGV